MSFWGDVFGEVGRCSAQDLDLLLEDPIATLEVTHLGGFSVGDTRTVAVLNVSLTQPVTQTRLGDTEVPRNECDRAALTGDRDDITTELGGIGLGHGEHPSSTDNVRTEQESTKPGAVPVAAATRPCD